MSFHQFFLSSTPKFGQFNLYTDNQMTTVPTAFDIPVTPIGPAGPVTPTMTPSVPVGP